VCRSMPYTEWVPKIVSVPNSGSHLLLFTALAVLYSNACCSLYNQMCSWACYLMPS